MGCGWAWGGTEGEGLNEGKSEAWLRVMEESCATLSGSLKPWPQFPLSKMEC